VRSSHVLFIIVVFAVIGYSCKEKGVKSIDQGEIHYRIDYVGKSGVPKEFLPQNLVVSFKKNKTLFEMIGIGNSGIINLANPEKEIFDTYFSVFTNRYFYAAEPGELYPGFESMDGIKIKKTSQTSVICGFNCKNAEITFPFSKDKVYEIWYTYDIKIKNPNASTPFRDVDGVLMSFFFIMGTSEIHFSAESVFKKDIPDQTFERRDKYKRVSRKEIDKVINMLIRL
jgi:hypothetical protein